MIPIAPLDTIALAQASGVALRNIGDALAKCTVGLRKHLSDSLLSHRNRLIMDILTPPKSSGIVANVVNVDGLADHQVRMLNGLRLSDEVVSDMAWAWMDASVFVEKRATKWREKIYAPLLMFRGVLNMLLEEELPVKCLELLSPHIFGEVVASNHEDVFRRGRQWYGDLANFVSVIGDGIVKSSLTSTDSPTYDGNGPLVVVAACKSPTEAFVIVRYGDEFNSFCKVHRNGRSYAIAHTLSGTDVEIKNEAATALGLLVRYHCNISEYTLYEGIVRSSLVLGISLNEECWTDNFPLDAEKLISLLKIECGTHKAACELIARQASENENWKPFYSKTELKQLVGLSGASQLSRLDVKYDKQISLYDAAPRLGRWDPPSGSVLRGVTEIAMAHKSSLDDNVYNKNDDLKWVVNLAVQTFRARVLGNTVSWAEFDDVKSGTNIIIVESSGLMSIRAPLTRYTDVYNYDSMLKDIDTSNVQPFTSATVRFLDAYGALVRSGGAMPQELSREIETKIVGDYSNIFFLRPYVIRYCRECFRAQFSVLKNDLVRLHGYGSDAAHIIREAMTLLALAGGENSHPTNEKDGIFKAVTAWAGYPRTEFQFEFDATVPMEGVLCSIYNDKLYAPLKKESVYVELTEIAANPLRYHARFTNQNFTYGTLQIRWLGPCEA